MTEPTTDRLTGSRPRLSVVIASSNDDRVLTQCLAALGPQMAATDVEVFVVRASDRRSTIDRRRVLMEMPALTWIDAPAGATVPQLRGLGMQASSAERIAVLEDDCVVADDWCRVAASTDSPAVAVGGAVEPGPYRRALDWAVYFAEYARFMRPVPLTPMAPLPGNNVVYARRALNALPAHALADFRESRIHAEWQQGGMATAVTDALVVRNVNSWSTAHVTSMPYHHGRAFAGHRFEGRSRLMRAGFAVLVPGLPFLKTARIMRETLGRRRFALPLLRALPWIVVFVLNWSAGEFVGALRGAGDSPSHWR